MMDENHNIIENIESYLSGNMTDVEKQLFEEKLLKDDSLKSEVLNFKMAQDAILAKGRESIKTSVNTAFETSQKTNKPKTKIFTLQRIISSVAAVFILAVSTFILWPENQSFSPEELFTSYYEVPVLPNVRSGEGSSLDVWNRTISFFDEGNYSDYIKTITPVLNSNEFEFRNEGYLFLGLSQLELENFSEAISAFENVSSISSSGEDADWFTALAYLKIKNLEEAQEIFLEISNSNHSKKIEATQILKSISK
jgi:tetratricopeptide (TPR) repeat protein